MSTQLTQQAGISPSAITPTFEPERLTPPVQALLRQSLRQSALLASINHSISDSELDALIATGCAIRFPPSATLIQQGQSFRDTDCLYIVEHGELAVEIERSGEKPVIVGSVNVNDVVGDQSLFTDDPPSASIIAQSSVHAYAIPKSSIVSFIAQHPKVQQNLSERKWLWSTMSHVPQFKDLDDDIKKESLISAFTKEHWQCNDEIVSYGAKGDQLRFYLVQNGQCEVRVPSSTATALTTADTDTGSASSASEFVRVAVKSPNESFGEISLLYDVPRCATAICITPSGCDLWSVDARTFRATCTEASLYLKKLFFDHASVSNSKTGEKFMTDKDFYKAAKQLNLLKEKKKLLAKKRKEDVSASAPQPQLTDQQLRLMFQLADLSGDKMISFSEFILLHSLIKNSQSSKFTLAFRLFDRDKSGVIDKAEFVSAIKSLVGDKLSQHDWSNDPFINELFHHNRVLNYVQFENLLNQDVLPAFLTTVKHDLRSVEENLMRWNALYSGDSLGMSANDHTLALLSWRSLAAGGFAGCVSRTLVSPLERVKLLFQMQGHPPKYTGVVQAMKLIFKEDGIKGYFRGNLSNVIRITPTSAIQFAFYDFYKKIFFRQKKELNPVERLGAGGLAGCSACMATYPLDLVRARLTLQSGKTQVYRGIIHGLTSVVRQEGFLGLYKGLWPSLAGIFPYIGIDFAAYETLRTLLPHNSYARSQNGDPRKIALLGCGATAGVVGQVVAYPLDLVRRRMQVQGWQGGQTNYRYDGGIWITMKQIAREEGMKGLYRGMVPNLVKVVPAVSISFVSYEYAKQWLEL